MSNKPRYVFDTNTIVSGFLSHKSNPSHALQKALERGEVLFSMEVAQELAEVLRAGGLDIKREFVWHVP